MEVIAINIIPSEIVILLFDYNPNPKLVTSNNRPAQQSKAGLEITVIVCSQTRKLAKSRAMYQHPMFHVSDVERK